MLKRSIPDAPLRRCDDCQLNLGTRPGDTLRAAFACPRFGMPRYGVESRCAAFVPKVLALAIAVSLAGCTTGRVFLGGGLTATDVEYAEVKPTTGEIVARSRNPFGLAAVGYEVEPARHWRVALEATHTSSLRTGRDRGTNAALLTVRWYPFD